MRAGLASTTAPAPVASSSATSQPPVAASAGPPPLDEPLLEPELPPLEPPLDEPLLEPELPPLEPPLDELLVEPELLPPGCTPLGATAQQLTPSPGQGYGSVSWHVRPLPGPTHVPPETWHTLPSAELPHAKAASRPLTMRNAIARRMAATLV
jgi:hypothetical protein